MDTDFIAAIAAVVLAAIIGWFENRGKKAKGASAPAAAPARKPAKAPKSAPTAQAFQTSPTGQTGQTSPTCPTSYTRPSASGQAAASRPTLKPLDADGLRNAVIWGEILQRKF